MLSEAPVHPIDHMKANKKNVLIFLGIMALSVVIGTAFPVLVFFANHHTTVFGEFSAFIGLIPPEPTKFLFPLAMAGVAGSCLIVEAYGLGYKGSTLYEIVEGGNASVRNDVFYMFMRISGLALVLAFVMMFGMSGHIYLASKNILDFRLLAEANPVIQFISLVVVLSFINYWYHRAFHTDWFFDLHKIHHSAEHYGVLLPFRIHPLNELFSSVYTVGALSLLGVHPAVMIAWVGLNGFYQCMVHTNFEWPRWVGLILITPKMHAIHHSTHPDHFNKNLGILTIWDKMFGTYHPPEKVPAYGVGPDEAHLFNTDRYLPEVIGTFTRWARNTFSRRYRRTA